MKQGEGEQPSKRGGGKGGLTHAARVSISGEQHGKPRGVEDPTIITIKIDGVVVDFDSFFKLPFEIVVLIGNDLRILQTYVMFGRKRVFG